MDIVNLFNNNRFQLREDLSPKEVSEFRLLVSDFSTRYRQERSTFIQPCEDEGLYYMYISYSVNGNNHHHKSDAWMKRYLETFASLRPGPTFTSILSRSVPNPYFRKYPHSQQINDASYVIPTFQNYNTSDDIHDKNDFRKFFACTSTLNGYVVIPLESHDVTKLSRFLVNKPMVLDYLPSFIDSGL